MKKDKPKKPFLGRVPTAKGSQYFKDKSKYNRRDQKRNWEDEQMEVKIKTNKDWLRDGAIVECNATAKYYEEGLLTILFDRMLLSYKDSPDNFDGKLAYNKLGVFFAVYVNDKFIMCERIIRKSFSGKYYFNIELYTLNEDIKDMSIEMSFYDPREGMYDG